MSGLKTSFPSAFSFSTIIPVRITDINYGGHVGNDKILSIIHEARVQYFQHLGYSELNIGGTGLIMNHVTIDFKKELFYNDTLKVYVTTGEFSRAAFALFYKLQKISGESEITIAIAKTGMVCYNYEDRKVTMIPEEVRQKLTL